MSIRVRGSSPMRFSLAVTVAMDGLTIPLFDIFKGKTGGSMKNRFLIFYRLELSVMC